MIGDRRELLEEQIEHQSGDWYVHRRFHLLTSRSVDWLRDRLRQAVPVSRSHSLKAGSELTLTNVLLLNLSTQGHTATQEEMELLVPPAIRGKVISQDMYSAIVLMLMFQLLNMGSLMNRTIQAAAERAKKRQQLVQSEVAAEKSSVQRSSAAPADSSHSCAVNETGQAPESAAAATPTSQAAESALKLNVSAKEEQNQEDSVHSPLPPASTPPSHLPPPMRPPATSEYDSEGGTCPQ